MGYNVFEDLGLPDAREEFMRANLTARIAAILQERHLTQKAAAKLLGIDQPKISALKNGRYVGFSVERLLSFLLALDRDVEILIKPRADRRSPPTISVHTVY